MVLIKIKAICTTLQVPRDVYVNSEHISTLYINKNSYNHYESIGAIIDGIHYTIFDNLSKNYIYDMESILSKVVETIIHANKNGIDILDFSSIITPTEYILRERDSNLY